MRRRLSSARAYYRLAAKADLHGQFRQGDNYRRVADRLVSEDRREREYAKKRDEDRRAAEARRLARRVESTKGAKETP